jgi:VWFA-related protein
LFRFHLLGGIACLSVVTFAAPLLKGQEPPSPAPAPAAQTSEPEFKMRVQKNVVVVRVVVRDSKGRTVGGLRKEDFRISDNKKPQEISSFAVETSEAAVSPAQPSPAAQTAKPGQDAAAAPSAPVSYLAFYFDDLYSVQDSLYRAGQAAEKFLAGLPPAERIAIFTSSGTPALDFTDDRQKIHEALMKLHANSRLNSRGNCPEINDYLANRIVDVSDNDPAWGIIADEAVNDCHWPPPMATKELLRPLVMQAHEVYRFQSRAVLKNLESVIERVAAMPGERQVMLVSDGFMDLEMSNRVESVVDHALRARVTISALVGAGLTVNTIETDTSRGYMPSPDLSVLLNTYNSAREAAATGTLAEIADGTGGQFFNNNNDLSAGMRKMLLPPEVSYVLTFSPKELKADGTFHALKVTLASGHGLTIQARKGYSASSKPVEVSSQTAPPPTQQFSPSGPEVACDSHGGKMAASSKAAEVPSQAATLATQPIASLEPVGVRGFPDGFPGVEMAASIKALEVPSRTTLPPAGLVTPAREPILDVYRRSEPITKWPLKKTLHEIPELKGLEPAQDQSQLPEILRRVSANLQKFVTDFVNTTALETIEETEQKRSAGTPESKMQKFRYQVLARREGSAFTLVEYRTDLQGGEEHPNKLSRTFIKMTGFASTQLFFGPLQQPWSDFLYLGRQKIGGSPTEAVAFAEHVDPVAIMGRFSIGVASLPILVQGVAWIRTSDYQILRIRTDLLAPLPPLAQVTTLVLYANTQFRDSATALWLPREVEVKVGLGPYLFSNRHRYSDYRLFRVDAVIKPDPMAGQHP